MIRYGRSAVIVFLRLMIINTDMYYVTFEVGGLHGRLTVMALRFFYLFSPQYLFRIIEAEAL